MKLRLLVLAFMALGLVDFSIAQEAGDMSLQFLTGYYTKDDPGSGTRAGNPFLDEDLVVIEQMIVFNHQSSDDFGYTLTGMFDHITSASMGRVSERGRGLRDDDDDDDDESGASGDRYFGLDASFHYGKPGEDMWGWHIGGASEYDYKSLGFGTNAVWQFPSRSANVSAHLNAFIDQAEIHRFDGANLGEDMRYSVAGTLGWYQAITPTMHGNFGLTLSNQTGFLSTSYNSVWLDAATEIMEILPDKRKRLALYGSVRQRLWDGAALQLGGRWYGDDWGIRGVSVEPRFYQMLGKHLRTGFHWRHYRQTPTDYWYPGFAPAADYYTQDSDLGEFSSDTMGIELAWVGEKGLPLELAIDHISRDDGLDHWFASIGFKLSF